MRTHTIVRPTPISPAWRGAPQRTKAPSPWPFLGLLLYVLAQVYLIPLASFGPKWAVWPMAADCAWALFMFFALVSGRPSAPTPEPAKKLFGWLVVMFFACMTSFVVLTIGTNSLAGRQGFSDGIFYLYRMTQFIGLFWATSRVPLTESRVNWLRRTALGVLLVSSALCILSYAHIVTGPMIAGHLPASPDISGPWFAYPGDDVRGLGAIGYNHAYTSAQIIVLVGWIMSLRKGKRSAMDAALIILGLIVCFCSHSRAGFAAMALFSLAMFMRNPIYVPIAGLLLLVGYFVATPEQLASRDVSHTMETTSAILDPLKSDQFKSRVRIWDMWGEVIRKNPATLVTGAGFGAARDIATVAHMLYLTVLAELGIIGFSVYMYFLYQGLKSVWEIEFKPKPFFWTTVVLLFASATQETFYPSVAFGHFLGFYMVAAATVLRYADFRVAAPVRTMNMARMPMRMPAPAR